MLVRCVAPTLLIGGLAFAQGPLPPLEDHLFGVKLGSESALLEEVHKGLYVHTLRLGDVLHEACNQKDLEVFTFSEEPWSLSRVTYIAVRKESDVTVCRDASGQLPDLGIAPVTPRGIRLGDSKAAVLREYGTPTEERQGMLVYRRSRPPQDALASNLQLFIDIRSDKVAGIALSGDMPGVKKP